MTTTQKPTYDELLDACRAVDIYFKALTEQWAANDGHVVSESGTVINASKDCERLCEIAAEKVAMVVARADGVTILHVAEARFLDPE